MAKAYLSTPQPKNTHIVHTTTTTKNSNHTMKTQQQPLLLLTSLLLLLLLFSTFLQPIPTLAFTTNGTDFIRTSCGATLYPELCYTSLSAYASKIQQNPARLTRVAIGVSLSKARRMAEYVSNLSRQADYGADPRAAAALHDCFSNFGDAVDEIRGSLKQMRQLGAGSGSFRFLMSNVQTWMSAALTDQDTCADGFEDVGDGEMKTDVCSRVADAKKFTSNALALVNSYAQKGTP